MLKWIGGCLVLVIVLLAGGSWFAMRSVRKSLAPDGSARVTIAASPERIYASLSDGDSLRTWMAQGNTVTTWRHGPLVVGDSISITLRSSLGMTQRPMIWRVRELVPNRVVALELKGQERTPIMGTRRDSLVALGDSTTVVSIVTSMLPDSTKSGTAGIAADMMLSMIRMQAKLELQSLKARIEGRPAPVAPPAKR
jgi:hypothetical protein